VTEQIPSVGRIVHYQSRGSADRVFAPEPRAAIITAVHWSDAAGEDDWKGERQPCAPGDDQAAGYISYISLAVLNPTGLFFDECVEYSQEPMPGCWSWPPRV